MPTDGSGFLVDHLTDPVYGIDLGPNLLTRVHTPDKCVGRPCVIHHPSNHTMSDWPLMWRSDTKRMERVCEHGVGHDDPDDTYYHREVLGEANAGAHWCDGCCTKKKDKGSSNHGETNAEKPGADHAGGGQPDSGAVVAGK